MKSFIRLTDYAQSDIYHLFSLTDKVKRGAYQNLHKGKTVILFFPNSSIRTRITFEKGIYLLGGHPILFPSETLNKKEDLTDVLMDFNNCQVTTKVMENANPNAVLNPCPPFYRGEEVSKEVIKSNFFVGYEFKKCLLEVQQAIMLFCLTQ